MCVCTKCCLRSACGLWPVSSVSPVSVRRVGFSLASCILWYYIAPRHTRCHAHSPPLLHSKSHRSRWTYASIGKVLDHVVPCIYVRGIDAESPPPPAPTRTPHPDQSCTVLYGSRGGLGASCCIIVCTLGMYVYPVSLFGAREAPVRGRAKREEERLWVT